jgi:hypothetical protein
MRSGIASEIGSALAWFAFPLVPALLGTSCYQLGNWTVTDPRAWGSIPWTWWVTMTGPLLAYGFLAGATIDLPDEPGLRGPKRWLSRRSLWVTIGPWVGFAAWSAIFLAFTFASSAITPAIILVQWAYPPCREWTTPTPPEGWQETWVGQLFGWALSGTFWYGWLFVVWAALRRAKRFDRLGRSLSKGLAVAIGFVGSLFGSFWTITEAWRGYFFDPRIAPVLVAALSVAAMSGCATKTIGDVRRQELFQAMLISWLLGLALAWRWWSRSRPKPPRASS